MICLSCAVPTPQWMCVTLTCTSVENLIQNVSLSSVITASIDVDCGRFTFTFAVCCCIYSIEPLWSFGKPQEEMPMDITQRIQWKSKITKLSIAFRRSIKALHWAIRCTVVSSSSWQRGQPESCRISMIQRCRLRSAWPVRSPTSILKSFLASFRAKSHLPLF